MTLKWIRRWARFLDIKLRLDHTLSQSTDKWRSDNSLFKIVLIERGFVMQSLILLYIKETDGRPAGLDWDKKSALAFFGPGGPPPPYNIIYIYIYIYIYIWYTLPFKSFWTVRFFNYFFKEVSSVHQACICLIQNTAKTVILWNVFNI